MRFRREHLLYRSLLLSALDRLQESESSPLSNLITDDLCCQSPLPERIPTEYRHESRHLRPTLRVTSCSVSSDLPDRFQRRASVAEFVGHRFASARLHELSA